MKKRHTNSANLLQFFVISWFLLVSCSDHSNKKDDIVDIPANHGNINVDLKYQIIPIKVALVEDSANLPLEVTTFDDAKPILQEHCSACHNVDREFKTTDRETISLIIKSVTATADQQNPLPMPPPNEPGYTKLTENQIFVLKAWAFDGGQLGTGGIKTVTNTGYRYQIKARVETSSGRIEELKLEELGSQVFLIPFNMNAEDKIIKLSIVVMSEFDEILYQQSFHFKNNPKEVNKIIDFSSIKAKLFKNQASILIKSEANSRYLGIIKSAKLEIIERRGILPSIEKVFDYDASKDLEIDVNEFAAGNYLLRITGYDTKQKPLGLGESSLQINPGPNEFHAPTIEPNKLNLDLAFIFNKNIEDPRFLGYKIAIESENSNFKATIAIQKRTMLFLENLSVGEQVKLQISLLDSNGIEIQELNSIAFIAQPSYQLKTFLLKL